MLAYKGAISRTEILEMNIEEIDDLIKDHNEFHKED